MPIGYIVQVENDCWVFGVIEYKKYAFQAWKPADFLNCFLCALQLIKFTYLINFIRGHSQPYQSLNFRIRKWKPCFSWIGKKVEDWIRLFFPSSPCTLRSSKPIEDIIIKSKKKIKTTNSYNGLFTPTDSGPAEN